MAIEEEIGQEFQEEPMAEMPVAEEQPVEEEVVTEEEVIEAPAGEAGPGTPPKKQQGQTQVIPGKGGQKTVVSGVTPKQPQQQPVKTLSKDADSPRSFLNYVQNPAKIQKEEPKIPGSKTFTEVAQEATEQGKEKREKIAVYQDYEANQRALANFEREKRKAQSVVDMGGMGDKFERQAQRITELPERFNDANYRALKLKADKARLALDEKLKTEVDEIYNRDKNYFKDSPGLIKESYGGVKTPDMDAIQSIAGIVARSKGLSEDSYFYSYLKGKLAARADFEIDAKAAKDEADRMYQQTYGKTIEQSRQKEAIIVAQQQEAEAKKAKAELSAIIGDYKKERDIVVGELQGVYRQAVDATNLKVKEDPEVIKFSQDTADAATAELQQRINRGEISYEDAVELSKSEEFSKALDKKVEAFVGEKYGADYAASFDQYMKDLNVVNSKYNKMFRRREEEVIGLAEQKMKQFAEKGKSLDATVIANYQKVYQKAYQDVRSRRKQKEKDESSWYVTLASGTLSSLGAAIRGYGSAFNSKELEDFGESLYSDFKTAEFSVDKISDLLDPNSLAGSISSIAGRALPGMALGALTAYATKNAGLTAQMVTQALTGWITDTTDQVGTIQADVFEKTGDIAKAENAGREMAKGQLALIWTYALEGLPFFGDDLLKGIKNKAIRGVAATGLGALEESIQEIPQGAIEEAIQKTGLASNAADFVTWENSYKTLLNVIPFSAVSGGGSIWAKGIKDYTLDQYAKAQAEGFIAKQNVADYVKDNKLQYMYNLFEQKGARFAKQYAAIMYSNGNVTEQELQQLTKKIDDFENFKAATKKAKMDFADNVAGFTLYDNLQQSKAALDAEKDEGAKIMLQQNYNAAKAEWESFTKGEGTNAVILSMPSGEKFVLSPEDADKMLEDDAVKQDIKDGKIGVQVFAKKGQEAVMQATADKMNVLFEQKPTLTKFTSPTNEKYGTVNRNDGKGEVTLTKEEFLREQGAISGVQEGVEGVPSAEPTEAGAAPTAMGEEGAKAEQAVTPEPAAPEGTKPESLTKPSELFDRVDLNEALEGEDLVNNIDETERKFSPEKMKQAGVITDNFDTIMRDMEKKGKIKIDCPPLTKASKGLAIGFIPGGTWEVVETFSGPTHKEGGIKIEIEGTEISYADADEKVQDTAKKGGFWSTMKNVGLLLGDTVLSTAGTLTGSQALSDVISEKQYGSEKWDKAADIAGVAGAVTVGVLAAPVMPSVTVAAGTAAARKTGQIAQESKMQNELSAMEKRAEAEAEATKKLKEEQARQSKFKPSFSQPYPIEPKKSDLGTDASNENIIKPGI